MKKSIKDISSAKLKDNLDIIIRINPNKLNLSQTIFTNHVLYYENNARGVTTSHFTSTSIRLESVLKRKISFRQTDLLKCRFGLMRNFEIIEMTPKYLCNYTVPVNKSTLKSKSIYNKDRNMSNINVMYWSMPIHHLEFPNSIDVEFKPMKVEEPKFLLNTWGYLL